MEERSKSKLNSIIYSIPDGFKTKVYTITDHEGWTIRYPPNKRVFSE